MHTKDIVLGILEALIPAAEQPIPEKQANHRDRGSNQIVDNAGSCRRMGGQQQSSRHQRTEGIIGRFDKIGRDKHGKEARQQDYRCLIALGNQPAEQRQKQDAAQNGGWDPQSPPVNQLLLHGGHQRQHRQIYPHALWNAEQISNQHRGDQRAKKTHGPALPRSVAGQRCSQRRQTGPSAGSAVKHPVDQTDEAADHRQTDHPLPEQVAGHVIATKHHKAHKKRQIGTAALVPAGGQQYGA